MLMKAGLALLLVGAIRPLDQACALELEASLSRAITNKKYQEPTDRQLTAARKLFQHTLLGDRPAADLQTIGISGVRRNADNAGQETRRLHRSEKRLPAYGHEHGRVAYEVGPRPCAHQMGGLRL